MSLTTKPTRGIEVFISYTHSDKRLRDGLEMHLRTLVREGLIAIWHDRDISAGSDWDREISQHLNTASIILLLISPDFIASEYCYDVEIEKALRRHEAGEACVIPILLRPTDWKREPFNKLRALP